MPCRWYLLGVLTCAYGLGAFGMLAWDAYGAAWTVFAVLSGLVALVVAAYRAAIHRECTLTRYADAS